MKWIKRLFKEANIDAEYEISTDFTTRYQQRGSFCIKLKFGDEVDGFKYDRELCIYDCQHNHLEVIKIIENDISLIKSELRRVKLKSLGL